MKRNGGFTGFSKKMAFALSICLILSNIPGYNLVVYAAEGVSVDDCLEGTVFKRK